MTTRQVLNAYIIYKLYSSYVIMTLDVYFLKLCSRLTAAVCILLSFCLNSVGGNFTYSSASSMLSEVETIAVLAWPPE